jgi:hypothetical protein
LNVGSSFCHCKEKMPFPEAFGEADSPAVARRDRHREPDRAAAEPP